MNKPYIIAELGSNFEDLNDALEAIPVAFECGADAIKFQCFTTEEMYGYHATDLKELDIYNYLPTLKERADRVGIDFMCTMFSPKGLWKVNDLVSKHKIASSDIGYTDLLEAAAKTEKPVFLSSGGANLSDITAALKILDPSKTTLLYCVSEYPSTWHNLRIINELRDKYHVDVGYSDHSIDCFTPVVAYDLYESTVIEKHFKHRAEIKTPDSGHSLDPEHFKYMCDMLRNPNEALDFHPVGEDHMRLRNKRRLVTTKDLNTGDCLEYGRNFGAYRGTVDLIGIDPINKGFVDGKRAARGLKRGTTLRLEDFG